MQGHNLASATQPLGLTFVVQGSTQTTPTPATPCVGIRCTVVLSSQPRLHSQLPLPLLLLQQVIAACAIAAALERCHGVFTPSAPLEPVGLHLLWCYVLVVAISKAVELW